jgi:hypothetical protein
VSATRLGLIALLALAAGLCLSCKSDNKFIGPPPPPPAAPSSLYDYQTTQTGVVLRWEYNASDIQGFHIYVSQDTSAASFVVVDTVVSINRQAIIDSLTPGTTYYFYITAFNQNGESARSNVRPVHTVPLNGPGTPNHVEALPLEGNIVEVSWQTTGTLPDSFLIQRHDTLFNTAWTTIGSTPADIRTFLDSSVTYLTHYYYRVGGKRSSTIVWSLDSALAVTFGPGAISAPESLRTEVHLGLGVILTWVNVTHNATRIVISRGTGGNPAVAIDTVAATATSYLDTLGQNFGLYNYRLQAISDTASSPLTPAVEADYRLCSPGAIPLCVGNFWTYDVTDTAGGTTLQRTVSAAIFFGGQDFYLISQDERGITDSLYYLRNDTLARGVEMLHWPLLDTDHPQLLFKYPALQVGDSFLVDGQKVEVVIASPGQDKNVSGTVYHGVLAYERFVSASFRIIYYIVPGTVGIIKEEHYNGPISHPAPSKTLSLRAYHVS